MGVIQMRVVYLTSPGRFPTASHDPGRSWDALATDGHHQVSRLSLNHAWWTRLFGQETIRHLQRDDDPLRGWLRRRALLNRDRALLDKAISAAVALEAMTLWRTYETAEAYLGAVAPIAAFLDTLNSIQDVATITLDAGPRATNLDYDDSRSLTRYARSPGFIRDTVNAALTDFPNDERGVCAMTVTTPEDLLTTLMAAARLREIRPGWRLCLTDHGYENFSLQRSIEARRPESLFGDLFDTIIPSKDDVDDVLPGLVDAWASGDPTPRFADLSWRGRVKTPPEDSAPIPLVPTFTPCPVLSTRLSAHRCYWSRCVYCSQNNKFASDRAPTRGEIHRSLQRLGGFIDQGCAHVLFSDEALSPSTLRFIASEIPAIGLDFKWSCRCRIELSHDADLFTAVAKAGCREILFGLETTSPRLLQLMDKFTPGLDGARLTALFADMAAAGVGVHVNLILGFPGETIEDSEHSASIVAKALKGAVNATYTLNLFTLFPDTIMALHPERFGILSTLEGGDICHTLDFILSPEIAEATFECLAEAPRIARQLDAALHWPDAVDTPGLAAAKNLYFGSGHGAIFKALTRNPFGHGMIEAPT